MNDPIQTRGSAQCRPLGNMNAAMRDLDIDADAVQALLDAGALIGFNIAARTSNRICHRILTQSIIHFNHTGRGLQLAWPEIFRLIIPRETLFLSGREVQRALNADQGHVGALADAGDLMIAKKPRRGRNGTPMFYRSSLDKFLAARLIGGVHAKE